MYRALLWPNYETASSRGNDTYFHQPTVPAHRVAKNYYYYYYYEHNHADIHEKVGTKVLL
jgi:hypothetical protein